MISKTSSVILVCVLSLALHVAKNSPISPIPLNLPNNKNFKSNNILRSVLQLGLGLLPGPEDLCFDSSGTLYTATRDGWIKRMLRNGSWEEWKFIGGSSMLGLAMTKEQNIILCDAQKGLLRVDEGGVTALASEVDGRKIRFADEVIVSSDGSVFFTDASSKFDFANWFLDILEAKPHGRLLKYDPQTQSTSVLLSNLNFANGVALSSGEEFLVVCETANFRCLRLWLKGDKKGETDIFIDNLPGGPDNINLAPDGSFWIATLTLRSKGLDLIHSSTTLKRIIASFPKLVELTKHMIMGSMVVNVASDGKLIRKMFDDYNGKVISFVTTAVEHDGHLYLGNLESNFIGKLALE